MALMKIVVNKVFVELENYEDLQHSQGRRNEFESGVPHMSSTGARDSMGVWGLCPKWGPWAKPLVWGAEPP